MVVQAPRIEAPANPAAAMDVRFKKSRLENFFAVMISNTSLFVRHNYQ
jgi:hypothetical protein